MNSLYGSLKDVIMMTWPTLFISLVVLISIRVSHIVKHKVEFVLYKEILLLLFILYILCLFQIVTAQDINELEGNNFIPFAEILRYKIGSKYFIKNIIGNVLMFAPYGFFVGKYASLKNVKLTLLLLFLASVSIEVTQLVIGRVFDVDDIILNLVGGLLGYIVYRIIDKIFNSLPKVFRSQIFLNIMSIILVIVIGVIFFQLLL